MSAAPITGYELITPIGRGGTAEVWLARRQRDGLEVALKRLPVAAFGAAAPEARDSLEREAAVLGALHALAHPGIVTLHEIVDDPATGGVALALEHVPGGSLADRLARDRRLPWSEVVSIAATVADALEAAHRLRIVHGDVKPANVLLDREGRPHLADFGAARWERAIGPSRGDGARRELVTGTVAYLDPAVLDGRPLDERSDVYALGVLCFEALTGRVPFEEATPMDVLSTAAKADRVSLVDRLTIDAPEAPEIVTRTVVRALAADPARRFATAGELGRALEAAAALSALSAAPGAPSAACAPTARAARTPGAQAAPPRSPAPTSAATTMTMRVRAARVVDDEPGPPRRRDQRSWRRRSRMGAAAALVAVATIAIAIAIAAAPALRGSGGDDAAPSAAEERAPVGPVDSTISGIPIAGAPAASQASASTVAAALPTGSTGPVEHPATASGPRSPTTTAAPAAAAAPTAPATPGQRPVPQAPTTRATTVGADGTVEVLDTTGGVRRVRLGRPGDQVLMADWNCDGTATVGLYRPTTGVFFEFPGLSADGSPVTSRPRIALNPAGTLRADDPDADGCLSPIA